MPNVGEPGARSLSFAKRFEQDLERVLLIYRIEPREVRILRIINARGAYLNERARTI